MTTEITWIEVNKDREYRVTSPIGDFDVWQFGPLGTWFVADVGEGEVRIHCDSFEKCLDAIRNVAEEAA